MTTYSLNIAKKTKAYPNGLHWALVEFGDINADDALARSHTIIQSLGRDEYVYTLRRTPTPSFENIEL